MTARSFLALFFNVRVTYDCSKQYRIFFPEVVV